MIDRITDRTIVSIVVLIAALAVGLASVVAVAASAEPEWGRWGGNPHDRSIAIEVDVAEDMTRFVYDEDVVYDDGMPAHGSAFVTQGYIYPAGTLDGTNGVLEDGSPEFPELVLGEWACFGYMINDAAHAATGKWVLSTQVFDFYDDEREQTIVTTGYELIDLGAPIGRAVVGGTGDYDGARGEASQTLLGLNVTEGVNLTLQFEMSVR